MTADHVDSGATTGTTAGVLPSARTLGKGLAVLRIFMGVILFANGVAKLFGFTRIQVGPYVANLIDREAARSILQFEVFENPAGGQDGTGVPGVRGIAELMLDNWGLFGWAITAMELAVGALLIVGLLTRLAALVSLGQALFLALVYASSDRWAFEQPHEYVPLIILALVPAGRVWGLDGRILRRRGTDPGELRGRPF
ncbi:MAG: DoxX family membrane protein [Actinomycetota bacterium]|nr:DoxX family membrane protein [Actinomycetota bacterium]